MTDPRIRPATADDVPAMVRLVHDLAAYERAPDECVLTEEMLHERLYGSAPALFAHVAEVDGAVVGVAIWFLNFSTWDGVHGIHLEDLYVDPAHRGSGLGRALLARLAEVCVERGYSRLQWQVLDWNTPSIEFYRSLGGVDLADWRTYRLAGEALQALGSVS
ncbi:GNAT family N-acetyltransferase [Aeromicrobium duanguangcaii]|uniref:GNAT family N-acetyltransferase n=1 Tax=Aeromicrobium duanguangcaii TaxID=2968086 RepID=A0ABY5KDX8_9ACTN|nr:GNAT family N-acetyltransferase [Aeromicrobium duanguangcaii]MCD9154964.1 GNAT family N-acetyltransferase [Aeromicrobium duanguangcaii]MCL3838996.1 GNAT family N-acetyltransferase [Aeromicrobium duanguangcaii]UUI67631.1 GNAT family N-acetyltransferase [Aeromicrobium duanguangcaii]